jgi:hypothetical protein
LPVDQLHPSPVWRLPSVVANALKAVNGGVKQMSKRINVNPGQYKVAGRERQGENLQQDKDKALLAKDREKNLPNRRKTKKR